MSIQVIKPGAFRSHLSSQIAFFDDFVSTNNDSGRLGEMGWYRNAVNGAASSGGAVDVSGGTSVHGLKIIYSAGSSADATGWSFNKKTIVSLNAGARLDVRIARGTNTDTRMWIGIADVITAVPVVGAATKMVGFRYDTAVDQNIRGFTKNGAGAETLIDCGAFISTFATYSFDMPDASTVRFFKDGVLLGTSTTNLPSGPYNCFFGIQTDAAAVKNFVIDFFEFNMPLDRT